MRLTNWEAPRPQVSFRSGLTELFPNVSWPGFLNKQVFPHCWYKMLLCFVKAGCRRRQEAFSWCSSQIKRWTPETREYTVASTCWKSGNISVLCSESYHCSVHGVWESNLRFLLSIWPWKGAAVLARTNRRLHVTTHTRGVAREHLLLSPDS